MERVQGARTPYEVYCHHCRVTFPREARTCVHCGGRLSPPGRMVDPQTASVVAKPGSPRAEPVSPADVEIEEMEEPGSALLRRFGGLAVWAVLALAAVISNMCQGRG